MAIDRIGKGGGVPGAGAPEVQPKATEKPFEVERPAKADAAAAATSATAATPLARLRAGEIDVHGYIDLKVDEATSALHGLSPAEIDEIKKTLRDQMVTDPGLADLVRTATGHLPKPPPEE
jgi:hypothetical protein